MTNPTANYLVSVERNPTGRPERVKIYKFDPYHIDGFELVNTLEGQEAFQFYKSLEGDIKTWVT